MLKAEPQLPSYLTPPPPSERYESRGRIPKQFALRNSQAKLCLMRPEAYFFLYGRCPKTQVIILLATLAA